MINSKLSINNYLKLEQLRNKLAKVEDLEILKKSYLEVRPYINPNTKKYWNNKINIFENTYDKITKLRINAVYKLIPKNAKSLLDIGIGYGHLEKLLEKRNDKIKITGFDISPRVIKDLKKKYNFKLFIANAESFPINIGKFDLVVALEVFEHIFPHQILKVLKRISKVLTKNGSVILSVPLLFNDPSIKNTFPYDSSNHVRLYSKELIILELKLAGYRIIETIEVYAYPNLDYLRNAVNLILKRWKPNILIIKAIKK